MYLSYEHWHSIADMYDRDFDNDYDKSDDFNESEYYKYSNSRRDQPKTPNIPIEQMNLQKLISLIPDGVNLEDIKFSAYVKLNSYGPSPNDGVTIKFFYSKTYPEDMEQYEKDKAAYDVEYAEYERKLDIYKKWEKEQEINKLKLKLRDLES